VAPDGPQRPGREWRTARADILVRTRGRGTSMCRLRHPRPGHCGIATWMSFLRLGAVSVSLLPVMTAKRTDVRRPGRPRTECVIRTRRSAPDAVLAYDADSRATDLPMPRPVLALFALALVPALSQAQT